MKWIVFFCFVLAGIQDKHVSKLENTYRTLYMFLHLHDTNYYTDKTTISHLIIQLCQYTVFFKLCMIINYNSMKFVLKLLENAD